MKLGMVTYQMGKDMTLDELVALCDATGLEGVELRTTHAHGVELNLTAEQRQEVKKRFQESPIELVGLGSIYEFHSTDPAVLRRNIEEAKAYAQLAADVGAGGIKVRPNGLPDDVPVEKACEQIGRAWNEVAQVGYELAVEVRMEVHGRGTSEPENFLRMLQHADHVNAKVCWNSNSADMDGQGSIAPFFDAVKERLGLVHINEIGIPQYPWHDLFNRLKTANYQGFCLAEIPYNPEPERFMTYYRTLFDLYTGRYRWPRE